jgi:Kef-type K+ transport system membrane component KefB
MMPEELLTHPLFILVLGVAMVLAMVIKAGLERIGLPALVGFLFLGVMIRLANDSWGLLNESGLWSFELLGELGVICILFRVGLENDPRRLVRQLPPSISIWLGNVGLSSVLGFIAARYVLGFELIPALFVATALSATSVGVSVLIWENAKRLKSDLGEQLIDVAELDDITAIIFMVALFAVAPLLHQGADSSTLSQAILVASGLILAKALLFGGLCCGFAIFVERRITGFFSRFERAPDPMIGVVGIAFVIAAFAGWLGFSVAVGGLFAGLAFSRDPEAVKMESSFLPIYELLMPFFFIGIGLKIDVSMAIPAFGIGGVLLITAIIGKVIGAGVPALLQSGMGAGALLGVSMVPRAEIALVVIETGSELGDWAVPNQLYGAMVVVAAGTCIAAPVALRYLFKKFPDDSDD